MWELARPLMQEVSLNAASNDASRSSSGAVAKDSSCRWTSIGSMTGSSSSIASTTSASAHSSGSTWEASHAPSSFANRSGGTGGSPLAGVSGGDMCSFSCLSDDCPDDYLCLSPYADR